jgi:transcriptional regulator of aromatic amino acid metabolism
MGFAESLVRTVIEEAQEARLRVTRQRLNVVTLTLPELRERPEDILLLAHYYLSIFSRKQRRPRSRAAVRSTCSSSNSTGVWRAWPRSRANSPRRDPSAVD